MGRGKGSSETVAQIVGFAFGMSAALSLISLGAFDRRLAEISMRSPIPVWVVYGVLALAFASLAAQRVRRNPFAVIALAVATPLGVCGSISRQIGPLSERAHTVRGIGVLVSFLLAFGAVVWFARLKRELDRHVFTRSALVSFFVMVIAGVAYGVSQEFFGAPELSFTWLVLAGIGTFMVALVILERRYA